MIDKERRTMPKGVEWPVVDGEPVVPGDVLWDESGNRREVRSVNFITVGCAYLNMEDGTSWMGGMDSFTRTEPPKPLLDRDGVPIEVGDTVYLVNLDFPMEVHDIHDGPGSYHTVECITEPGHTVGYDPGRLTHEAPDSWERLEEDAAESPYGYWGCEGGECCDCPALVNGETPRKRFNTQYCSEAVRLDIVRRAKALAGVATVYADPPYRKTNTRGYEGFNHGAFDRWLAQVDFPVYVSEYTAPEGCVEVASKEKQVSMAANGKGARAVEKIFVQERFAGKEEQW